MLRRNVLIFHQGALGDFVLTWPLALAMGRLYPQSRIIDVTAASKGRLAEKVLGVDAQDAETGWPALHAPDAVATPAVRKALDGAHAIFDFSTVSGSTWAVNVARLSPHAEVTFLPARPPAAFGGHATDCLLGGLVARPAIRAAVEQILRSLRDRGVATRRGVGEAVVIHPGSGSATKNWPLPRFVELAKRIADAGNPVRFIVGEVERDRWASAELAQLAAVGTLQHPADYVALHAALIDATAYIGNDSGPSHLAAVCGVPTVAIFTTSDPRVWSPVGPRVNVLGPGEVTVDEVLAAVSAVRLGERPTAKIAARGEDESDD